MLAEHAVHMSLHTGNANACMLPQSVHAGAAMSNHASWQPPEQPCGICLCRVRCRLSYCMRGGFQPGMPSRCRASRHTIVNTDDHHQSTIQYWGTLLLWMVLHSTRSAPAASCMPCMGLVGHRTANHFPQCWKASKNGMVGAVFIHSLTSLCSFFATDRGQGVKFAR
jgi:hypothetical protein